MGGEPAFKRPRVEDASSFLSSVNMGGGMGGDQTALMMAMMGGGAADAQLAAQVQAQARAFQEQISAAQAQYVAAGYDPVQVSTMLAQYQTQ